MDFTNEELQELVYNGNFLHRQVSQDFLVRNLASELFFKRLFDNWISVEDRLPEKHGYYMWWDEREQKPYIEHYTIGELPYPGLSHWQYLPKPPKKDE